MDSDPEQVKGPGDLSFGFDILPNINKESSIRQNNNTANARKAPANARDFKEAVKWGEMAFNISPGFSWGRSEMGFYYIRNVQADRALEYYRGRIAEEPGNGGYWVGLAAAYESIDQIEQSLSALLEGAEAAPDHKDIFKHGFQMSALLGKREEAVFFVKKWIERHPNDKEFMSLYRDIDRVLYEEFGIGAAPDSSVER